LISLIARLSFYPNAKFCVSSRPWIVFEDAFRTRPQLMLQDLTYLDVLRYITDKLTAHPGFEELQRMNQLVARSLLENIAKKASGVFLWVVVAVRSLAQGLMDGDRLTDLQKRLDSLPPELDDLLRRILRDFNPQYFRDASALFQIVKASIQQLNLLALSFADEDNASVIEAEVKPITQQEKRYKSLNMRRRLDSRCKGLLEILPIQIETESSEVAYLRDVSTITTKHADLIADAAVDYLHRTVKDFLEKPETWEEISTATEPEFNPNAALARSYLLQSSVCTLRMSEAR
jgi:hypothetical protein